MKGSAFDYALLALACLGAVVILWMLDESGSLLAPYVEALALFGALGFGALAHRASGGAGASRVRVHQTAEAARRQPPPRR